MSTPDPSSSWPRWVAPLVTGVLVGQLALTWIHGLLLHRQHRELVALRKDLQTLVETLDQGQGPQEENSSEWIPLEVRRPSRNVRGSLLLRTRLQEDSDQRATKELQESEASARKAVTNARNAQEQLSLEENARKAEERSKIETARQSWGTWSLVSIGVLFLAWIVRGWLRRRG